MFLPKIKDKNFRKHCSPVSLSKLTTVRKYCFRNQSLMFPIKYIAWLVQNTTESSRKKEVSHLAKLLYFILSTSFFLFWGLYLLLLHSESFWIKMIQNTHGNNLIFWWFQLFASNSLFLYIEENSCFQKFISYNVILSLYLHGQNVSIIYSK